MPPFQSLIFRIDPLLQQKGVNMKLRLFGLILMLTLIFSVSAQDILPYQNADLSIDERVADLLERMTLEEKLGQMTLIEKGSINPDAVTEYFIGAILSGGGGYPTGNNSAEGWMEMVHGYQDAALATRLGIPMIYGVDAVHGHSNLSGAVIFPHNVGLGATRNPELIEEIGQITALEMIATGIYWDYSPVLAVPQDIRWGRTYEGYSENTALVAELSSAMLRGLQGDDLSSPTTILGTPKHFVGDGGTVFGTSDQALLDRGNTDVDEATLRAIHLPPYYDAIENGARSIMISYSSWGGERMHGQEYLINDVLIEEMGFEGFIVSDWQGINDVAPNFYDAVVEAINAGIDMNMVPYDYIGFIDTMTDAVDNGDITMERLDEAVGNILTVKMELGLFERPFGDETLIESVGSDEHRAVAREAVSQSLVLLKNENNALPIDPDAEQTVFIAGASGDNIGIQSGGWTIEWQGVAANVTEGTTIRRALQNSFGDNAAVRYSRSGRFNDENGNPARADIGIVVVGEQPYAEWFGDNASLALSNSDRRLIESMREKVDTLVVVLISGRPMVIDQSLNFADAFVAAWLPGTEGYGLSDVLLGERDFVGKLPYTWLRNIEQLPFDFDNLAMDGCEAPLFPYDYGLSYESNEDSATWLALSEDCAPVIEEAGEALPVVALASPDGESLLSAGDAIDYQPKEVAYIPYPVAIAVDGNLSDWNGIPFEIVDTGTSTSSYPEENGHFQFSLAADEENVYLYMVMPDATIVTGEHGGDYWNEDSMELYFNFTDDPFRNDYTDGVFQININPGNIGNTDPSVLSITGVNSGQSGISGFVFPTQDGWGFEVAVPIPDSLTLEHGLQIGFQAHANGSSGGNRDVKLIWSAADTGDTSYQTPSVFGIGVFYEPGNPDAIEISERVIEVEVVESDISINQLGYFVGAPHFGMLANNGTFSTSWVLIDEASGEMVYAGSTGRPVEDVASGDIVTIADFSEFNELGTYRLMIYDRVSEPFTIGNDIYADLAIDSARYFYLNRSGLDLLPEFAEDDYARPAGHLTDNDVTCYRGTDLDGIAWDGCDYTLDSAGGWYDAGDYGKYVVNGGISLWTLLNLYERLPESYVDGSLNIPESSNGIADILDEARYEMEWLLSMQVPEGNPQVGMVHHKLHDLEWETMPLLPPGEFDNNNDFSAGNGRYVYPPSTAATYNMAATAAQCARIWRDIDNEFAEQCLNAAIIAFNAGRNNPIALAGNTPGEGGGNYDDSNVSDELFWAAAELYITTNDAIYLDAMAETVYLSALVAEDSVGAMYWGDTAALGALSLSLHMGDMPEVVALEEQLTATANAYLETINNEGYRVPITEYEWGSNSAVLNNAIILAYAYDITGDIAYLYGMTDSMDYLLGRNALAISFISGYGDNAMQHPHHRFWANQPENAYPAPPAGVVAGGPNAVPSDPTALEELASDIGPARRYIDAIGSWSTNEVTINWNAPLTWVSAYLNSHFNAE